MRILGIETAGAVCAAALVDENGLAAESRLIRKNRHAEFLPQAVERVLADSGTAGRDLQGIAVSGGPGSFTGLRIGLGLAKGMAYALRIPLILVPTPDCVAAGIPPMRPRLAVWIPARRGEVYQNLFRAQDGKWIPVSGPENVVVDTLEDTGRGQELLMGGEGADLYRETLESRLPGILVVQPHLSAVSAWSVARLGRERLMRGEKDDLADSVPNYLTRFKGIA